MGGLAFYAPMKPPTDPVPSGDRTMARALLTALDGMGYEVTLASEFRSRDAVGDPARQNDLIRAAKAEADHLANGTPPALWLTYHSYYKAPDLLGPALSRHWGVPYVLVEATRARKRLKGNYATFAAAAEAACDAADVIFWMTGRDRFALQRDIRPGQRLIRLRPFLAAEKLPPLPTRPSHRAPLHLLTCAMFRAGDKIESYRALAAALGHMRRRDWRLTIVGDGPEAAQVKAMFSRFGEHITFAGELSRQALTRLLADADAFLWPGVNEAYGMVYLEAQAQGCPVLAEDRPGVRDIVRDGGWLVPPNDPKAFAVALERLMSDGDGRVAAGRGGRDRVAADHLLGAARASLSTGLDPLLKGNER